MDRATLEKAVAVLQKAPEPVARLPFSRPVRFARRSGALLLRRHTARRLRNHGCTIELAQGYRLVVDPSDLGAQALFRNRGSCNVATTRLWRALVNEIRPHTILDIGTNYGQVVLSTRYDWRPRLVLIEPNPAVVRCLQQTLKINQLENVTLYQVAASSRNKSSALLELNNNSSGLARLRDVSEPSYNTLTVPTATIDALLQPPYGRLLAKIDTEGHEWQVLCGMTNVIQRADEFRALCEYGNLTPKEASLLASTFRVTLYNRFTLEPNEASPCQLADLVRRKTLWPYLGDAVLRPNDKSRQ